MKLVREHLNEIKQNIEGSGLGALGVGRESIKRKVIETIKEWESASWQNYRTEFTVDPDDLSVSIVGNFFLDMLDLETIPDFIKFKKIDGNFFIVARCNLTSLRGVPTIVNGDFKCSGNELHSLEFAPEFVKGSFSCDYNRLESLEFLPNGINGDLEIHHNQLNSLKYCPKVVNGNFNCSSNRLDSLWCGPEIVRGDFNCSHNYLKSLEFVPRVVSGNFIGRNNPVKFTHIMVRKAGCRVGGVVNFKST